MRPLIGIPCHADFRAGTGRPIYCNNRAYVHALESAGGTPILIPLLDDLSGLDTLLPRLDGLLLPGGIDVRSDYYGEEPHPLLDEGDRQLDELELTLARWALQEDIPTLGVCRGMQLLNVAMGGSLYQDLLDQYPGSMQHCQRDFPRTYIAHRVYVEAGSQMDRILGTREFWVNSLHHQGVKTPGKGAHISGRAEDGVAELLEAPAYRFMMAVQCHPEEIYTQEPACARLFSAFVRACSTIVPLEEEAHVEAHVAPRFIVGGAQ
jgi:putative glutamine amidotransferase